MATMLPLKFATVSCSKTWWTRRLRFPTADRSWRNFSRYSKSHPGHYKTLHDHFRDSSGGQPIRSDTYLPSRIRKGLEWCEDGCPSYAFTSKTDQKRHQSVIHGTLVQEKAQHDLSLQLHKCDGRDLSFKSKWLLRSHRRRECKLGGKPKKAGRAKKRKAGRGAILCH